MSKSALIMDKPKNCHECIISRESYGIVCCYEYKYKRLLNVDEYKDKVYHGCQLIELPERYNPISMDFERGYNACIDDIYEYAEVEE